MRPKSRIIASYAVRVYDAYPVVLGVAFPFRGHDHPRGLLFSIVCRLSRFRRSAVHIGASSEQPNDSHTVKAHSAAIIEETSEVVRCLRRSAVDLAREVFFATFRSCCLFDTIKILPTNNS